MRKHSPFSDGRSRESRTVLLERGTTSHIGPQVGFSQYPAGSRILGILRAMLERRVLGMDSAVFRMVCISVHIPQPWRRGSPPLTIPRHTHLGVARCPEQHVASTRPAKRMQSARRWPSHSRSFTAAATSWPFQNAPWNPQQTWCSWA